MSKEWTIRKRRPVRRKNIAPLLKELEESLQIDLSVDGAFLEMAEYGSWQMVFVDKVAKTVEVKDEENQIMGQLGNDPIAKLKARELDLQAKDNARKEKEGEDKMNLDRMKAMMNQANVEEKLDQNEELAQLRADTSIQKTILGKTLPSSDKTPDQVSIIRGGN